MVTANTISFQPLKVAKGLLAVLPNNRTRDVVERRFGLGKSDKKETLEAIGKNYGITRERVRQIENYSLNLIRQSDPFQKSEPFFQELKTVIASFGGMVEEKNFVNVLAKSAKDKNCLLFFMVLGKDFNKLKEDEEFKHRWLTDGKSAEGIQESLRNLHKNMTPDDVFSEEDITAKLAGYFENLSGQKNIPGAAASWLNVSNLLAKNPLDQWGLANSPRIRPRGVRDLAYIVMEMHGSPMHFTEVSSSIEKSLGKSAYVQTVHNELIKDKRFVLVGRGLYALKEWGYKEGRVCDIIKDILTSHGPLPKEDLIKYVLKERHIKESTILINIQNKKYFKKLPNGRYSVKSMTA